MQFSSCAYNVVFEDSTYSFAFFIDPCLKLRSPFGSPVVCFVLTPGPYILIFTALIQDPMGQF